MKDIVSIEARGAGAYHTTHGTEPTPPDSTTLEVRY